MSTNLRLRIRSVKCVDETGNWFAEKFGNDEIYLGGFLIDDAGNPYKLSPFSIYPHFDDGDEKKFQPAKEIFDFNLVASPGWPKNMTVGFLLFEKDAFGSADTMCDKAFNKLKQELTNSNPNALKAVADYVLSDLYREYSDDIFTLATGSVDIPNANHTWNGSTVSPEAMVEFKGNDGRYRLYYDWELYELILV